MPMNHEFSHDETGHARHRKVVFGTLTDCLQKLDDDEGIQIRSGSGGFDSLTGTLHDNDVSKQELNYRFGYDDDKWIEVRVGATGVRLDTCLTITTSGDDCKTMTLGQWDSIWPALELLREIRSRLHQKP